MSLRELYQEMIIDHGKNPRNTGVLPQANHCHCGYNPLCGDQLTLQVMTNQDLVEDIRFQGSGCAISVASASLMTEAVKGKRISEVEKIFEHFHHLVTHGNANDEKLLGKLTIFAGVAEFPIRVKCATLAWHTLKAALANTSQEATTE